MTEVPTPDRSRREKLRAFAIRATTLAVIVGTGLYARSALGLDGDLESVRETVGQMGVWGPVIYIAIVSFRQVILVPHMVALVVGGLVFGTVGGTIYGAIGLFNSAVGIFLLTRWMGADSFRKRLSPRLHRALDRASTRGGIGSLALVNAYPFMTITVFHAAAGLTTMSLAAFAAAIAVTSPIRTWVYAYFGSAIVEGSTTHIVAATAIMLLLLTPLLIPRVRARIREEFAL